MKAKRYERIRRLRTMLGLLVVLVAGFAGAEFGRHQRTLAEQVAPDARLSVPTCGPAGNYCIGDLLAAIR